MSRLSSFKDLIPIGSDRFYFHLLYQQSENLFQGNAPGGQMNSLQGANYTRSGMEMNVWVVALGLWVPMIGKDL